MVSNSFCTMAGSWSWRAARRRRGRPPASPLAPGRRPAVELHSEREPHRRQDLLDLVERLAAEVLGLEHLDLGLLDELADGADVRGLEAVVGAHRQLHLVDALGQT